MNTAQSKYQDTLLSKTSRFLESGRINDALLLLRRAASDYPPLKSRLDTVESTYRLMTKYFLDGAVDESRSAMLNSLKLELFETADRIERLRRIPEDSGVYYATARMLSYRPQNLSVLLQKYDDLDEKVVLKNSLGAPDIDEMKNREELSDKIFNYIWTMGPDDRGDLKRLRDRALGAERPDSNLSAQIVSALLLALLTWYDREKFLTLISIYESAPTEALAARALTAIILVLSRHNSRIVPDQKLMERLGQFKESLLTYRRLRETVRTLVRTRDTDRVVTKMRSEVLPGMMRLGPDIIKKMKEASAENGLDSLEENPEWEEMMRKSGLAEKLRELTEMQLEGADVMMVAFSNLKGFPFFSKISNWFLPFTTDISPLYEGVGWTLTGQDSVIDKVLSGDGIMCDSDKFSFLFALSTVPEENRKNMINQLQLQSDQIEEAKGEIEKGKPRPEFDAEAEKYVRDLYRFFKIYPKAGEFFDPFAEPIDFLALPVVADILKGSDILELIAEFYFRRRYFKEAVPMLRQLSDINPSDPHLWEKLGMAVEMASRESEPDEKTEREILACYMKAELLSPDSRWLAKRIGRAYARVGKWKLAKEYLMRVSSDSETIEDLLELSRITEMAGDKSEALKYLYKANYLQPGIPDVKGGIARLEALSGELDKALKFALPEENDKFDSIQWRLLGNIRFLRKEYAEAAKAYRHLIRPEHKHREWKKEIMETWPELESRGASLEEMQLLLDYLTLD